jgi:anti-repressor protein
MTDLIPFDYGESAVRVIMIDGEPWFVAADVCRILGLANTTQAVSRLDQDGVSAAYITDDLGRQQRVIVVNEAALYDLVFDSRRPEAKAFRRWVTNDVLPSLRKTGQYAVAEQFAIPRTYAEALELAAQQARAIEDRDRELAAAKPKIDGYDALIDATGNYKIGDVAKVLAEPGLGQNKLFELLRQEHVLITGGKSHNSPYQSHVDAGRFVVRVTTYNLPDGTTASSKTTYATPKGLDYIRKVVTSLGYVTSGSPRTGGNGVS